MLLVTALPRTNNSSVTIQDTCPGFRCRDGTCISVQQKCNDIPECPDQSDEGEFVCQSSNMDLTGPKLPDTGMSVCQSSNEGLTGPKLPDSGMSVSAILSASDMSDQSW